MTYLRSIVFAVLFMCMGSKSAVAWQIGFDSNLNPKREIQAEGIIITWSEENDELRGFSQKLGEWEVLKTDPQKLNPGQIIIPIVAANVAAVRFGDSIAAFSGEKGWWDVIDLEKGSTEYPFVSPSLVKIDDNGHLYTFSANKGSWSSPTDPELQEQNRTLEVRHKRTSAPTVFADVNNRMKQFESWRDSLPAYKRRGILLSVTSGSGTGTATLSASRLRWMTELEAKVRELFDVIDPGEENGTISDVTPDAASVQALEQRIEGMRTELSTLEQNVRSASQSPSEFKSETDQRHELRKQVEQSFDLRQQLQELEAQRLREKLQQVENNLVVRAKSREAIVDRRLRELFNTTPLPEPRDELAGFDGVQLLAFHASWDHATHIKTIWDNLLRDGYPIEAVNINEKRTLAIQYKISSVPTSVLVVNGKEVKRFAGQTSERELKRCLNEQRDARTQTTPTPEVISAPQPKLGSDPRIQWPQPTEIAKELRNLQGLATRYLSQSEGPKNDMATWSQPLEKLISDGHLEPGSTEEKRQANLNAAQNALSQINSLITEKQRDWDYAWSAYQTQLQLLRLDVAEATNELNSLTAKEDRLQQLAEKEVATDDEVQASVSAVAAGKIRLQRAEQVLKLYADIEANEPELNPTTLKGLDEIAANKEVTASVPNEPGQNLPLQVIRMAEQLRKLRDAAVKIREERQPHQNLITQYSRPLDQLKAEGVVGVDMTEEELKNQINRSRPEFDRLSRELDAATKAWRQAWNAYQSQSRLLELEVKHAENSLVSAEQTLAEIHVKRDQGLVGSQEVRDIDARRSAAVARLEKAREVLHLWQELENNEPELKPESSTKNLQVSSSGEAKTQKGAGDTEKVTTLNDRLKELRDEALRLRKERQADEALLTQCSRPLEELKAEGVVSAETTAEELERKIKESRARYGNLFSDLQTAMSKWRETWSVYPKGLLSMEDQIKEIEHRIESEQRVLEQAEARNKAGLGDPNDVKKSQLTLKHLKEEILPDFQKIVGEMEQEIERLGPEFNPDWKPAESKKP